MDDDDELEMGRLPARRFCGASDLFVMGFGLLAGIADSFLDTFNEARQVAAMHANWQVQQKVFQDEARKQIETLISGDEKNG